MHKHFEKQGDYSGKFLELFRFVMDLVACIKSERNN